MHLAVLDVGRQREEAGGQRDFDVGGAQLLEGDKDLEATGSRNQDGSIWERQLCRAHTEAVLASGCLPLRALMWPSVGGLSWPAMYSQ